jgi:Domain of unknown function (DUF4288)
MGYIPEDSEWYVADLVMEITVHGASSNVVHRNLTLVNAHSPEEAHEKATRFGYKSETSYENTKRQLVEIRFRGIAELDVVYEPLEDGAELMFEERIGVSSEEIQRLIPSKEQLDVFVAPKPGIERDPDYRSKATVDQALQRSGNN